jgi:hypothetical protein
MNQLYHVEFFDKGMWQLRLVTPYEDEAISERRRLIDQEGRNRNDVKVTKTMSMILECD